MGNTKKPRRRSSSSRVGVPEHERKLRNALRSAIRQVWSRYSQDKKDASNRVVYKEISYNKDGTLSKKKLLKYKCASCKLLFSRKEINIDHVEAVGRTPEVKEFDEWGKWMSRLFCDVDGLQVLCIECHAVKSKEDRRNM